MAVQTHRDLRDSLRLQLPMNAGELALTLAAARLRFKCDFGGEDHGREAGYNRTITRNAITS